MLKLSIFPKKKIKEITNLNKSNYYVWKINDKSNDDQLKAVTGICLMLGALIVMGLYSNLPKEILIYFPISFKGYIIYLDTLLSFRIFSFPCHAMYLGHL